MVERPAARGMSLALGLMSVLVIASEFGRTLPAEGLWDFGSFVASGRAARDGLNPYGIYPLTLHVVLPGFESWNPNLNPPISAILFQVFDLADPHLTFRAWWVISICCYAAAVILLLRRYGGGQLVPIGVTAFALAGFWDTLLLGQIYVPLALAAAAAWLLLERGADRWAGLLMGVVIAMKPNFLVWPVVLLLAGHRLAAGVSLATALGISAIPLAVFGPEIYRQWFELIASDHERAFFLTNASLSGLAARASLPWLGTIVSFTILAALAWWAIRYEPSKMRASALALVAALLASPLAWVHYTLFLLPVFVSRWSSLPIRAAMLLLIVPVPFIIGQFGKPALVQFTIGSVYAWALVLCALTLALEEFPGFGGRRDGARARI